jgi:hypothetical protein
MPVKTWDSESDWGEWALTNLDATTTPGLMQIAAGYNSGTALSPVYEAASWERWSKLLLAGSRPQGTNIYLRFRSGASAVACEAADWSDYIDGLDADGALLFDLQVYILNEGYTPGAFIQLELSLFGE